MKKVDNYYEIFKPELTPKQKLDAEIAAINSYQGWRDFFGKYFVENTGRGAFVEDLDAFKSPEQVQKWLKLNPNQKNSVMRALQERFLQTGNISKSDRYKQEEKAALERIRQQEIEDKKNASILSTPIPPGVGFGGGLIGPELPGGVSGDPRAYQDEEGIWHQGSGGFNLDTIGDMTEGTVRIADNLSMMADQLEQQNSFMPETTESIIDFTALLSNNAAELGKTIAATILENKILAALTKVEQTLTNGVIKRTGDEVVMDITLIDAIKRLQENISATKQLTGTEFLDIFWLKKQVEAIGENIAAETGLTGITEKLWAVIQQAEIPSIFDLVKSHITGQSVMDEASRAFDRLQIAVQETIRRLSKFRIKVSINAVTGKISVSSYMPGFSAAAAFEEGIQHSKSILGGLSLEEMMANAQAVAATTPIGMGIQGLYDLFTKGFGDPTIGVKPIAGMHYQGQQKPDSVFGTGQREGNLFGDIIGTMQDGALQIYDVLEGGLNNIGDAWKDTVTMFGTGAGWFGEPTAGFQINANKGVNVFGQGQNPWNPIQALANVGDFIKDPAASIEKAFTPFVPPGAPGNNFPFGDKGFEAGRGLGFGTGENPWNPLELIQNAITPQTVGGLAGPLGLMIANSGLNPDELFDNAIISMQNMNAALEEAIREQDNQTIETLNVNMNIENIDPTTNIEAIADEVVDRITDEVKPNRRF